MLDEPEQIVVGEADTVTVGLGFTVTVTVCGALLQPSEVPSTVYVVVPAGVTVIELAVAPLLQA